MKSCIIGASGYTGVELAKLLQQHPTFSLDAMFVSENSADAHRPISDLYPSVKGLIEGVLQPLNDSLLASIPQEYDAVFLATPHEASHAWAADLLTGKAKIFDLSGAFRLQDTRVFEQFYGFAHTDETSLKQAVYGLAEWYADSITNASFVAVPGCYPTASLLATKPLMVNDLIDQMHFPVINATSGVSGAGRKASLTTSLCEVSLQSYGVLSHRHTPEIAAYLGQDVIFTPHLGNFKRGILATVVCKLKHGVTAEQVKLAFEQAYAQQPLIRLLEQPPKLDDVVGLPVADIYWKHDVNSDYVVINAAIDNLLKGAASQAVQCANLSFGIPMETGLIATQGLSNG